MKSFLLRVFFYVLLFSFGVQQLSASPDWLWAKTPQGKSSYFYSRAIALDSSMHSIIVGSYPGSMQFDETHSIKSNGSGDIFIAKYDKDGNVVWVKSFGGNGSEDATSVAIDRNDNIYVVGFYKSTSITFDSQTLNNQSLSNNIFILKLDQNGNVLWVKSYGDSGDDRAYGVAIDLDGNCFITGYFASSTITFAPPIHILMNSGGLDAFIVKISPDGNVLWANAGMGSASDYSTSIATDRTGSCYVTGYFNSTTLTFGNITLTKKSNFEVFVVKYDASGNCLWANHIGGTTGGGDNNSFSVATDTLNNCYISGIFQSADFIVGSVSLSNKGAKDMYVIKFDANGNPLWGKSFGGTEIDGSYATSIDKAGHCYLTGYFNSSNIAVGNQTFTNSGIASDLLLVELDQKGDIVWAKSGGNTKGDDLITSIAVDTLRNFYITGYWSGDSVLQFDNFSLSNHGSTNIFIAKSNNLPLTSINENETNIEGISIFPNPSSSNFINLVTDESYSIQIFNSFGQMMFASNEMKTKQVIDITSFAKGVYFVKLRNIYKIKTMKFIKL